MTITVGIALGLGTRLADNQENVHSWLGSLTAPWILAAFTAGAIGKGRLGGAAAGAGTLTVGVVAYYAWMRLIEGGVNLSYFLSITTFWLLIAPIAGALFGLAGAVWRESGSRLPSMIAIALPAGIIAGESGFMAITSRNLGAGDLTLLAGLVLLGFALPVALLEDMRDRDSGILITGLFLVLGLAMIPAIRLVIGLFE